MIIWRSGVMIGSENVPLPWRILGVEITNNSCNAYQTEDDDSGFWTFFDRLELPCFDKFKKLTSSSRFRC
jgi:hypothetical protein